MRNFAPVLATLFVSACASGGQVPHSASVASVIDPVALSASAPASPNAYRIGPSDKLAIRVFQVPDLSFDEIFVDAGGNLQLPLLGQVTAAGLTPNELATELQRRLGERYLRNPQVAVTVSEASSQKVTVDGAVTKPGVYEMRGRTTLLQAVAMAEGPTRTADIKKVAVFRNVDDRPMVAIFDLGAIRQGNMADPVLLGEDIVVVDTSQLSVRTQELLQILPAVGAFIYYLGN